MQETELTQLLLQHSPQVPSLLARAINGNKQLLRAFCGAMVQLLANTPNHAIVYEAVNELLISAEVDVAVQLDGAVMPAIANLHVLPQLDEYVVLWRGIMPGTGRRSGYPNLAARLARVKTRDIREMPQLFQGFAKTFQRNFERLFQKRVQFFEDFDGSSLASESQDEEMSSAILEMDMQQIEQIKARVESEPVDELSAEQYLKKVKNFLSLRPKSLKKQLSLGFNNNRIWAKQFIAKYDQFLNGGSLHIYRYYQNNKNSIDSIQQSAKFAASNANIVIHDQPEEVVYQEQAFRRTNSKRFDVVAARLSKEPRDSRKQEHLGLNLQAKPVQQYKVEKTNIAQGLNLKPLEQNFPLSQSNFDNSLMLGHNPKRQQPNFILSPQQIPPSANRMSNSSRSRHKIFANSNVKPYEEPKEQQLQVTKHGKKMQRPSFRATLSPDMANRPGSAQDIGRDSRAPLYKPASTQNVGGMATPQQFFADTGNSFTPASNKILGAANTVSPGTAFRDKTQYGRTVYSGTGSKKLSQFKQEKRQRKIGLANEELSFIDHSFILPYSQNFDDTVGFCRFRRSCLDDNPTLYTSPLLLISCTIKKISDLKVRVQLLYQIQSHNNLSLQTLYRVPKCLKVQKISPIHKRWGLQNQEQHIFTLELLSFPLEPCLLNLKYCLQESRDDFKHMSPIIVSVPVTMRSFMQYLVLSQDDWIRAWTKWTESGNLRLSKHIVLDKGVAHEHQLPYILRQLTELSPIQGYSIKQFGGYCQQSTYQSLSYLTRISQRLENIMTVQIVADRPLSDPDTIDCLQYCLSMQCMLLAKLDID